jgi:hypothetical protein
MICSPFPKLLKMLLQEIRTARDSAACDLCREPREEFPLAQDARSPSVPFSDTTVISSSFPDIENCVWNLLRKFMAKPQGGRGMKPKRTEVSPIMARESGGAQVFYLFWLPTNWRG